MSVVAVMGGVRLVGHAVAVAWQTTALLAVHVVGQVVLLVMADLMPPIAADCAAARHASCRQYAQPKSTTRPISPNESVKVMVINNAAWPRWPGRIDNPKGMSEESCA